MKNNLICFNGSFIDASIPVITALNRGLKYGDGFFETIRVMNNKIVLKEFHFKRLFESIKKLKFSCPVFFTPAYLEDTILQLVNQNKLIHNARVRINIFRGDGSLYQYDNNSLNFIIEAEEIHTKQYFWNKEGLLVDFFIDARKVCDQFSHIKSNNFLPYTMAAIWAKENNINDAIILNQYNNIAETTVANIWIVNNGIVKTPPLSQGCIDGVMRKYLIQKIKEEGLPFLEAEISIDDIKQAQEIFLTNIIKGMQWVKYCNNIAYTNSASQLIFANYIKPLNKLI